MKPFSQRSGSLGVVSAFAFASAAATVTVTVPVTAVAQVELTPLGSFGAGVFDGSAAEISAFDAGSQRLFVTNSDAGTLDVLDVSTLSAPTLVTQIALGGGGPNSVAVSGGLVAVAVEASTVTDPGEIRFFNAASLADVGRVGVGSLPDQITFTPDGRRLVVANEGEADGGINPVGSVSIIDVTNLAAPTVRTAGFEAFNAQAAQLQAAGVRLFPGQTLAEDVEPEFVTITPDGRTAFVSLQEANSVATVDLETATVTGISSVGSVDHSLPGQGIDPSDRDDGINIQNVPVRGLRQPDAIATYQVDGRTFLVTANEGDDRGEAERIGDLVLEATAFPNAAALQNDAVLGRLEVSTIDGDTDGDGDFDELFAFGSRSFSIFEVGSTGEFTEVFDSGDAFEQLLAVTLPAAFGTDNDENDSFDSRSDASGPEPEGLTLGEIDGRTYAFIGLERPGGIVIYDITDPASATFESYLNLRDFTVPDSDENATDPDSVLTLEEAILAAQGTLDPADAGRLDLGPEGLTFVSAADSPNGQPLLFVTNEVSGTTTVFAVPEPGTAALAAAGLGLLSMRRRR